MYISRVPYKTDLHAIIRENYRQVFFEKEIHGIHLPFHLEREFKKYLTCGILAYGMAVRQWVLSMPYTYRFLLATKPEFLRSALEGLCRYVLRGPLAKERISYTDYGQVKLKLKNP